MSSPSPFDLVAPEARLRSSGYRRGYDEYAGTFGKSARTVQYWVACGDAHPTGERPPLDSPEILPAWWSRVMKQKVPVAIAAAARVALGDLPPPTPPTLPAAPSAPSSSPIDFASAAAPSFERELVRLAGLRESAWTNLEAARFAHPVNEALVATRTEDYRRADEAARKAELHAQKMRVEAGILVEREQVSFDLVPMLQAVALQIRSLLPRAWSRLVAASDEAVRGDLWQSEIDSAFDELRRSGYAPPLELRAA